MAVLTDGIDYQCVKIAESFKLPPSKSSKTAAVHLHIRHASTINFLFPFQTHEYNFYLLKYFIYLFLFNIVYHPFFNFMWFNKA